MTGLRLLPYPIKKIFLNALILFMMVLWCRLQRTLHHSSNASVTELPQTLSHGQCFTNAEFMLSPLNGDGEWFSIDGEPFEAVRLHVSVIPSKLQVFVPPGDVS